MPFILDGQVLYDKPYVKGTGWQLANYYEGMKRAVKISYLREIRYIKGMVFK
jgi:hypothetical protein